MGRTIGGEEELRIRSEELELVEVEKGGEEELGLSVADTSAWSDHPTHTAHFLDQTHLLPISHNHQTKQAGPIHHDNINLLETTENDRQNLTMMESDDTRAS